MGDLRYLTVSQAAEQLQTSDEMVRRMLRDGRLRGKRLGGRRFGWRVAASEVERLLQPDDGPRLPRPTAGPAKLAAARRAALEQAERARARGDDEGAERFETIAAGMPH